MHRNYLYIYVYIYIYIYVYIYIHVVCVCVCVYVFVRVVCDLFQFVAHDFVDAVQPLTSDYRLQHLCVFVCMCVCACVNVLCLQTSSRSVCLEYILHVFITNLT